MTQTCTPSHVALQGKPGVGKSAVQEILQRRYGIVPADDGKPLREACKQLYSIDDWHVYTQEGKASTIELPDGTYTIRQLLGYVGVKLDELHGPDFIPWAAIKAAEAPWREHARIVAGPDNPEGERACFLAQCPVFCYGSVRRQQARVYQAHGGIAVEIVDPRDDRDFENDFDRYDRGLCDHTLLNDEPGLDRLEAKTVALFDEIFQPLSDAA